MDQKLLTVRATARRLGVHENTVRNWAERGILREVRMPGSGYRRFEEAAVEELARSMQRSTSPPSADGGGLPPGLVDATFLHEWTGRERAPALIQEAVRRLLASSPGVTDLSARAGEGLRSPGWDARVDGGAGTPWVLPGPSRWEVGTGARPGVKAQGDYEKRTEDPIDVKPEETAFVFVTPRRWAGKDTWASKREQEGPWRRVRVLDADDLEAWLRATPAVHLWLSEQLGFRAHEMRTLQAWWEAFSAQTKPALSAAFLLAGRDKHADRLREALQGPVTPIAVKAASREEAAAFIAAALAQDDAERPDEHPAPAVVVDSPAAWAQLIAGQAQAILTPMFESPDVRTATAAGHRVALPLGAGDIPSESTIVLPRPERFAAGKALQAAGMSFERADRMAALARRNFASFRRVLAVDPRYGRPEWASREHAHLFAPLLLLGAWTESQADREIVEAVTGESWNSLVRTLKGWLSAEDAPITHAGGEWRVASLEDAWELLKTSLTEEDISRWHQAAVKVLTERDPAVRLPQDERPYAALRGATRAFSSSLRQGMSSAAALLGSFGDDVQIGPASAESAARSVVRTVLTEANDDQRAELWHSLSSELPLLAEADPEGFLDAVESGVSGEPPLLVRMFTDEPEASWLHSHSPHTGLLWALERLCWSPQYLSRSSLALGRLAEIDPGGRLSNRPARSLRMIFLPWFPQTAAKVADRLDVIRLLRERYPEVAWKLLVSLLPRHHDSGDPIHAPRFRDWKPDREGVPVAEWLENVKALAQFAIEEAGSDADRWIEFVDHLGAFPPEERDAALDALDRLGPDKLDADQQLRLWRKVTDVVAHHRQFPEAEWSMDDAPLRRLEAIAGRLEPQQAVERYARLFDWHPDLPGVDPFDHESHERELTRLRKDAVRDTLERRGVEGLVALARESNLPGAVGFIAAEVAGEDLRDEMLTFLGEDDPARTMARDWLWKVITTNGRGWADDLIRQLADWPPIAQTTFLFALPPDRVTWSILDTLGSDVRTAYWSQLNAFAIPAEHAEEAAKRLLDADQPWVAVDMLTRWARHPDADDGFQPSAELVETVLRAALKSENVNPQRTASLSYEIGVLIDYLEGLGVDRGTLGQLEWAYFPLLEHNEREPRALFAALATDPQLFVDLVSLVYRGESEEPRTDEDSQARASHAWQVLNAWRRLPGVDSEGQVQVGALSGWVRRARALFAEREREVIGDEQIGQVLSASPPGSDGAWPAEPVRDLLEELSSEPLDQGFQIGVFNSRGITTRGPYDGGAQERALAEKYRDWANGVAFRWPRTAKVLRGLADSYFAEARREDERAARDANED